MPRLTITTLPDPVTVPDDVQCHLSAIPEIGDARGGDIIALGFHFHPGRLGARLSPRVTALVSARYPDAGPADVEWVDLAPEDRLRLAPLAMAVLSTGFDPDGWLGAGLEDSWPDWAEDAEDGVTVFLMRGGLANLPISLDDVLAYGDDDARIAIVPLTAPSAHGRMIHRSGPSELRAFWSSVYRSYV